MQNRREFERHILPVDIGKLCADAQGRNLLLCDVSLGGLGLFANHNYKFDTNVGVSVNSLQFEITVIRCEPIHKEWYYRIGSMFSKHTIRPQTLLRILSHYLS